MSISCRITRAKGSSEYCISHLLAPGAFARMPMVNRVAKLNIPVLFSCKSGLDVELMFLLMITFRADCRW